MATDPIVEMQRMLAQVRAIRRQPRRVRIHPLDEPVWKSTIGDGVFPPEGSLQRVMGIPVEIDCAVRRGHPEIDY